MADNKYLENYLFAEYVIKTFINDDRNYQSGCFFRAMKISRKIFNYCVEIINFLNPSLYQEYLDAVALISEKKTQHMIKNINLIAEAIKTGYLNDGSKFDILDFYRFISFIESGLGFVSDLKRFMRECDEIDDGVYEIITNYMRDNKITGIMFANGLPRVDGVFRIVLKRYLEGSINFDNLDKMEDKSRNSKSRNKYQKPYKLEYCPNLEKNKKD